MTDNNQKQLGKTLWNIADQLRGAMNADDFRDYMLSFLFLRYLSDNYETAAKKELGADYPDPNAIGNGGRSPLAVWYAQQPRRRGGVREADAPQGALRHQAASTSGPASPTWPARRTANCSTRCRRASSTSRTNRSRAPSQGLFSEINLGSDKLGKTYADRNAKLCTIITEDRRGAGGVLHRHRHAGRCLRVPDRPVRRRLGQEGGRVLHAAADFRASSPAIVTLDSQEPKTGKRKQLDSVLDFACGSGSLLLNVRKRMGPHGIGKIYGQEKNITTYNLARMNMLLHGVKDTEFEIYHGDTLTNDWDMLRETNPAKKPTFDAVVANPPFSYRWEPTEAMGEDMRFKNYGLAPKSAADFAFLLHGFHYLKDDGVMAIILPHGVLFRGGAEERIRTKLLKDGHIDTVIGLPANLFYSTGIPVCILVLKKCKKPDDVLFINAAEHFEKGKRQNQLTDEHIDEDHRHLPAPSGEHRALRPPRGDGGDRGERLQPEHLPLRQHGRAGGRDRSDGDAWGVGRNREADSGGNGEAQCVSEGTWTIPVASARSVNRAGREVQRQLRHRENPEQHGDPGAEAGPRAKSRSNSRGLEGGP